MNKDLRNWYCNIARISIETWISKIQLTRIRGRNFSDTRLLLADYSTTIWL